MSPETQRKSSSKGWAAHERQRKAAERKEARGLTSLPITTPEDLQRKFSVASWRQTLGLLDIYTSNMDDTIRSVFEEIRQPLIERDFEEREILHKWHGACYKDASTGTGQENKFRSKYINDHIDARATEPFPPLLVQRTTSLRKLVEGFVIKNSNE